MISLEYGVTLFKCMRTRFKLMATILVHELYFRDGFHLMWSYSNNHVQTKNIVQVFYNYVITNNLKVEY